MQRTRQRVLINRPLGQIMQCKGMKLLNFVRAIFDPYEAYSPKTLLPTFDFSAAKPNKQGKQAPSVKNDTVVVPKGYEPKLTSVGISLQKTSEITDGIEVELMSLKDARLHKAELDAILSQYPSVNQNAVIIAKKCWSKGLTIPLTIIELRKNGCEYSRTYVAFFRKVFDEFLTKIGEGAKEITLSPTPIQKMSKKAL